MGIFGLGSSKKKPATKKKPADKQAGSKEAKAVLAKMKAKKDSGDCAFC